MKIIVVGPRCWGIGKSLNQAVAKARDNWWAPRSGCQSMPYNAYESSDDGYVDEMGYVRAKELKRVREVRIVDGKRVVRVGNKILGD